MTFVKTFEEFKTNQTSKIEEAISGGKVKMETPKEGELARFTVTLKSTADSDTISDANPAQSALDFLVKDKSFTDWFKGKGLTKNQAGDPETRLNSQSIAFIETGKHRQAGFLKREMAVETFVFKEFAIPSSTDSTKSFSLYDLSKMPAQAKAKVADSNQTVYAWNKENEASLKLAQPIRINSEYTSLTADKIVSGQAQVTANSPAETPKPTDQELINKSSTQTTNTAQSGESYTGLKSSLTVNQKVKDLQNLIIAKGGPAADAIKAKGGADGKYGTQTAKAIGILIGSNKDEAEITADIDAKLKTALAGVQAPAAAAPVAQAAKPAQAKPAQPKTAKITTPGGKTLTFE